MQYSRSIFLKAAATAAVALGALGASVAHAGGGVAWSVGINAAPGVVIGASNYGYGYHQPAPVYVQPQAYYPGYYNAPMYVQPAPIYYRPAPVVYGYGYAPRYHGHRHGGRGGHGGHGGHGHRR